MASVSAPATAKRKARRSIKVWPIVLAVVAAGGGWFAWSRTHPADDPTKNLITAKVTRGDLLETVSATGSVTAQTGAQVKIGSQITGRIKRLFADVGSTVKAGEVIAELDLPDIQAQLGQAQANLAAAQTRLAQQESGVGMQRTQTSSAVATAQAAVRSAQARLAAAQAAANQQTSQTPTDIRRAEAALSVSQAALSTAKSNQKQVQAGANLQIASAQEQLNQATANANNANTNLKRQQQLYQQGFVAAADVDTARTQAAVYVSQVSANKQNVQLVRQKVAADVQAAKDSVTQAEQNVESATAALAAAKAGTYTDAARLADVNDARAQLRQAQANLQTAMANTTQNVLKQQDVQQAQEAVRAAEQQVQYNQAQVAKTYIRSPISGTVLQLAAQQGETLAAGLSAPTLIIVADLNRLQVDAYVDETDIGKVRLGQPVDITVDAFPKRVFKGTIAKIASGSTIQQGVVTYDVSIALENPAHVLKPDMTASVTILTGRKSDVLLVPSEAVKANGRGATVQVLRTKDGKPDVQPVKVRTGGSDGTNTEIREGLKEGDTIVLAGMDNGRRQMGPASPFGPQGGGGGRRGGGGR